MVAGNSKQGQVLQADLHQAARATGTGATNPGAGAGLRPAVDPACNWVVKESGHATCIVKDAGELRNARRQFAARLEQAGSKTLFLDSMNALRQFEYSSNLDDLFKSGASKDQSSDKARADGAFRKLLREGGTLIVNVSNFTPGQLGALHTLMEEGIWKGTSGDDLKVARDANGQSAVRIVGLADVATLQNKVMSGAWMSRANKFHRMDAHKFPPAKDPAPEPTLPQYAGNAQIVNLEGDRRWRRAIDGNWDINEQQHWEKTAPRIDPKATHPLVLRNLPTGPDGRPDPYLMDMVLEWMHPADGSPGRQVRLELNLPEKEMTTLASNKVKAIALEGTPDSAHHASLLRAAERKLIARLADPATPVCTVNASTISETISPSYGEADGLPKRLPSILERLGRNGATPLVHVTETLEPALWDRLMQHGTGFEIVAAPHIEIPERYASHVHQLSGTSEAPAGSTSAGVTFSCCADPSFAPGAQDRNATRIYVTPGMHRNNLLSSLAPAHGVAPVRQRGKENTPPLPAVSMEMRPLLAELKQGRQVILQGLENNPELASELASLLHPPHYIEFNGERLHFGPGGGLTGKLLVLTPDQELIQRHGLTAVESQTLSLGQWKDLVVARLQKHPGLAQGKATTREQLDNLVTMRRIMIAQGMIAPGPQPDIPLAYPEVEKLMLLLRTMPDDIETDEELVQARLTISLLKDNLAAGHGNYEKAKVLLKTFFPYESSLMPENSGNLDMLRELLEGTDAGGEQRVFHPQDILDNAWTFLNLLSPDLIKTMVGAEIRQMDSPMADQRKLDQSIAKKVLLLVLEKAEEQSIALSPPLKEAAQRFARNSEKSPLAGRELSDHAPRKKSDQNEKNRLKAELALKTHRGVLAIGAPGNGKSHWMATLPGADNTLNAADVGTPRHDAVLNDYAHDGSSRPILKIDEFNLANSGAHDMITGVFENNSLLSMNTLHAGLDSHRIIAAENDQAEAGRQSHPVERKHFVALRFKSKRRETLQADFVTPLLHTALATPDLAHARTWEGGLSNIMLDIHEAVATAFPTASLSGRHLQEYGVQVLALLQKKPELKPDDLRPWMAQLALTVYRDHLPPEHRPALKPWLLRQCSLDSATVLPRLAQPDLSRSDLAMTDSTQALADTLAWFLEKCSSQASLVPGSGQTDADGLQAKPAGQIGMLIEGPASRGKDALVEAMIGKRPHVRLNPNPDNLDATLQAIEKARKEGTLLWISELNLLPPQILDSKIGPLLSGDVKAAPGFGIIATINPAGPESYAGTRPLSSALDSRFLKTVLDDYSADDQASIASSIADRLSKPGRNKLVTQHIGQPNLDRILKRLENLRVKLNAYGSEQQPKIRELRDTITMLHHNQGSMTADEAFDLNYSYYETLAAPDGEAFFNLQKREPEDRVGLLKTQLQACLKLAHGRWLSQPTMKADDRLDMLAPVSYDPEAHVIKFHPDCSIDVLGASLLELVEDGLPTTPTACGPASASASGVAGGTPANTQGRRSAANFDPRIPAQSGVGDTIDRPDIGTVSNAGGQPVALIHQRMQVDGTPLENFEEESHRITASDLSHDDPLVHVDLMSTVLTPEGKRRLYLPAQQDTMPAIGGQISRRDPRGAWYVNVSDDQIEVPDVEYRLKFHPDDTEKRALHPLFNGLDLKHVAFAAKLDNLYNEHDPERPGDTVNGLLDIFAEKELFQYSQKDAAALEKTSSIRDRIQHFLVHGLGVCFEIATSFAAILEQKFKIHTRLTSLMMADRKGNIAGDGHQALEYLDEDRNWVPVDPTQAVHRPSATRQQPVGARPTPAVGTPTADSSATRGGRIQFSADDMFKDEGRIRPSRGDSRQNRKTDIDPAILRHFSASKVAGTDWAVEMDDNAYNANEIGELDMPRFLLGIAENHRSPASKSTGRPRAVYIDDLPGATNPREWDSLLAMAVPPLQALIDSGCHVHYHDKNGKAVRTTNAFDLDKAYRCKEEHKDDIASIRMSAAGKLLARLSSHFGEAVLKAAQVDPDQDEKAARHHLLVAYHDVLQKIGTNHLRSPLKLNIGGKPITIGTSDMERYRIESAPVVDGDGLSSLLQMLGETWISNTARELILETMQKRLAEDGGMRISGSKRLDLMAKVANLFSENFFRQHQATVLGMLRTLADGKLGVSADPKKNDRDLQNIVQALMSVILAAERPEHASERRARAFDILEQLPTDLLGWQAVDDPTRKNRFFNLAFLINYAIEEAPENIDDETITRLEEHTRRIAPQLREIGNADLESFMMRAAVDSDDEDEDEDQDSDYVGNRFRNRYGYDSGGDSERAGTRHARRDSYGDDDDDSGSVSDSEGEDALSIRSDD